MTIKDKTVLVTGANRGIGQALAEEAAADSRREALFASELQPSDTPDGRHDRQRDHLGHTAVRQPRVHRTDGPRVR